LGLAPAHGKNACQLKRYSKIIIIDGRKETREFDHSSIKEPGESRKEVRNGYLESRHPT
jgi:hypothetical protein